MQANQLTIDALPEFGERLTGQTYTPRPGSYALLFDRAGRISVMDTPRGSYLPGGGVEPGETPEEALAREVREECGLEIAGLSRVGAAVQYVCTPGHETGIRKECTFFRADVAAEGGGATEPDHVLLWLTPAEAERRLAHASQVWAIRQAAGTETDQ